MHTVLEWLPLATVVAAVLGASVSFLKALAAIRARTRFRAQVNSDLPRNPDLQSLRQATLAGSISETDRENLQKALERLTDTLSEQDRRAIERGLYQRSRAGQRRYMKDLLSAA